ncbi:MAG: D-alanyl-D-alanine carboxypeptidase family protein, partial [Candidatus Omnitrophica bacterium]|nr:D-alanyl-D-alanine carboxypeptidase family protein [Candidatus Omnitrophota bacterium]
KILIKNFQAIFTNATNEVKIILINVLGSIIKYSPTLELKTQALNIIEKNFQAIFTNAANEVKIALINALENIICHSPTPELRTQALNIIEDNSQAILTSATNEVKIILINVLGSIIKYSPTSDLRTQASNILIKNFQAIFTNAADEVKIALIDALIQVAKNGRFEDTRSRAQGVLEDLFTAGDQAILKSGEALAYLTISANDASIRNQAMDTLADLDEGVKFIVKVVNEVYSEGSKMSSEVREKLSNFFYQVVIDIDSTSFAELPRARTNKVRIGIAYNLIKTTKDDKVIDNLLNMVEENKDNNFGRFLISIFSNSGRVFSEERASKIKSLAKDGLLYDSLPYGEWFNTKRNPDKVIGIRLYFAKDSNRMSIWKPELSKLGFKKWEVDKKTGIHTSKATINGVTFKISMRIGIPEAGIFEYMDDPETHYIIFNGHAGMGTYILNSYKNAPEYKPEEAGTKLVQLAACWTTSEYTKLKNCFPNVQFIGTTKKGWSHDGNVIMTNVIEAISEEAGWDKVQIGLDNYTDWKYPGNYLLPNDASILKYIDSDGDGTTDGQDRTFNIDLTELAEEVTFEFRPTRTDPGNLTGGKVTDSISYVNNSFSWDTALEQYAGRLVPDGWYAPEQDTDELFRVSTGWDERGRIYKVKINVGYSNISREVLTTMLIHGLNKHFAEQDGEFSADDDIRGLTLVAEYLDYYHHEDLFNDFLEHYGMSADISFELINDARDREYPTPEQTARYPAAVQELKQLLGYEKASLAKLHPVRYADKNTDEPDDLVEIDKVRFNTVERTGSHLRKETFEAFAKMYEAAKKDGVDLRINSSYRSYSYQNKLFEEALEQYGSKDEAIKHSAPAGFSKHHTGMTMDFFPVKDEFSETKEYTWLKEHASEFGFVESYPEGNVQSMAWEPWEWTYVGDAVMDTLKDGASIEKETPASTESPGACFLAGTKITLYDRTQKNIEDIKIHDELTSYDIEENTLASARAAKLHKRLENHYYTITLENGKALKVTKEHPFYVEDTGGHVSLRATERSEAISDGIASSVASLLPRNDRALPDEEGFFKGTW